MTPPRRPLPSAPSTPPTAPWTFAPGGLRAGVILDVPRLAAVAAEVMRRPGEGDADSDAHSKGDSKGEDSAGRAEGVVLPYRERDVLRHVSGDALRVESGDPLLELYRDPGGERFWLVDERWGLCEINLLRRSWRSWVLPEPALDDRRVFEASVLWPLAHLGRGAGVHLIPAAAVGRDGRGVLILSPFDVTPELDALRERGVGAVGRRWVALRGRPDGRMSLESVSREPRSVTCELVLLVEPMRRATASAMPMSVAAAREQLKRSWPVVPLTAAAASANAAAGGLARSCAVHRVRLGRDGEDLARLLVRPAAPARRAAA